MHGTSELCSSCSIPDFKFKDIKIVLCTSCHSYLHKNKWTKYQDVNTAISVTALEGIKSFVKIKKISKELKEEIDSHKAGIKDDLNIEVVHKTQIFDIPAKLEVTLCPKCSKEGTQFFDSTIQLRNCTEEILAFARNEVKKQQKKGIFITKEVPLDKYSIKDIDMFLTNQTYAKTLAEKIKKNFGGTIKFLINLWRRPKARKNLFSTKVRRRRTASPVFITSRRGLSRMRFRGIKPCEDFMFGEKEAGTRTVFRSNFKLKRSWD